VSGKRIPKQGEVWTLDGDSHTIVAVDGDVVVVRYRDGAMAAVTPWFATANYTPPAPTRRSSTPVRLYDDEVSVDFDNDVPPVGHLIVWSDGAVTYEAVTS
jgi:hypothetical protein